MSNLHLMNKYTRIHKCKSALDLYLFQTTAIMCFQKIWNIDLGLLKVDAKDPQNNDRIKRTKENTYLLFIKTSLCNVKRLERHCLLNEIICFYIVSVIKPKQI